MPDLLSLLMVVPNAISTEEIEVIMKELAQLEQRGASDYESSLHAITGKRVTSTFRAASLPPGTAAFEAAHRCTGKVIQKWMAHLDSMGKFNINAFRQCLRYAHDYRVLRYDEGAQIHPHTDWDMFTFGSCTLALNDDYTGGEFSFFNGEHIVRLRRGEAMIWPADCFWVHEVNPVKTGCRYSINSFLTAIPEEMKLRTVAALNALPKDEWKTPYQHPLAPGGPPRPV